MLPTFSSRFLAAAFSANFRFCLLARRFLRVTMVRLGWKKGLSILATRVLLLPPTVVASEGIARWLVQNGADIVRLLIIVVDEATVTRGWVRTEATLLLLVAKLM